MKKIILTLMFFAVIFHVKAQTFQHLTSFGGANLLDVGESCITIADGKIFIQDEDQDDVEIFSLSNYDNLGSFGSTEINDSEDGIAVINNRIFVVDNRLPNAEIDVFDLASPHNFETSFGSGILNNPEGMVSHDGLLFVSDINNSHINIFSATSPYASQGNFGGTNLQNPRGLAVANGKIFVLDSNENHVEVFSATSPYTHLGTFGGNEISRTGDDIAIGKEYIYVIDDDDDKIEVFELAPPYKHITQFGSPELREPECIEVSGDRVFILDDNDNQVEVYRIILPLIPIPTLSQWGLFIFALILLNLGVMIVLKINLIESN